MLPGKLSIPTLSILVAGLIFGNLLLNKSIQEEPVSFLIRPRRAEYSVGDKLTVSVYLVGSKAKYVSVAEIRISFDRDSFKLVSSKAGTFFENPLVLKWDEDITLFSLAEDPRISDQKSELADSDQPIVELEFLANKPKETALISVDPSSQVYIRKKGVLSPQRSVVYYKIR